MSCRSNPRRPRRAAILAALAIAAGLTAQAHGQDNTVQELMRKVSAGEAEDGFCARVPWRMSTDASEHRFLEFAEVGTAEAARFPAGQCSYSYVTQVYPGAHGKCVRYTWWACGPGKTCATGESTYCKNTSGTFDRM